MSGTLRIGLFEGFKGQDTLLLAGDAEAMTKLAEVFQALALLGIVCRLESLPFVEAHRHVRVVVAANEYDEAWWLGHG